MTFPLMIESPIVFRGVQFYIKLDDDNISPLTQGNGAPVTSFAQDWRPARLYTGFAPIYLLELEHTSGKRATWFLDHEMRQHGEQFDQLPAEMQRTLTERASPLILKLVTTILCNAVPQLDLSLRTFLRLDPAIQAQIASRCPSARPEPKRIDQNTAKAPVTLESAENGRSLSLDPSVAAIGFTEHFQVKLLQAMTRGVMTWPSPIDAAPCPCVGGFFLSDFQFAYRFFDATAEIVFYVLVSQHYNSALAIYIPAFDQLIGSTHGLHLTDVFFPRLAAMLSGQAFLRATTLALTFGAQPTRFVTFMRGRPAVHMVHQLWNELTGLEKICQQLPPEHLPEVVVLTPKEGTELYGPIDELFPPLSGRVNRSITAPNALIDYAYRERIFLCRVTQEHVTASLREAILRRVRASGTHAAIQSRIGTKSGQRRPVIIIGLRVENRTLIDLVGFFCGVQEIIARLLPGAIVVVDGHNARDDAAPDAMIEGDHEHLAVRPPTAVELEVAEALEAHARQLPLTFINNIGAPLLTSLAWCDVATGFIAVWGDGLAKYRWVANLPGFILSSRANLGRRNDFDIYDSPQYMENPTKVVKANPNLVFGLPDIPVLVPVKKGPFYANFTVDDAGIRSQISELLTAWRQEAGWTEPPPGNTATLHALIPPYLPLTSPCRFAICLVVRNEVHDLTEWLLHYYNIGIERFYIYDHKSTDGTTELLGRLQNYLPIVYTPWSDTPIEHTQTAAFNHCLQRTRGMCEWVLFPDSDEFLIPPDTHTTIDSLVARAGSHNAMALNWVIFGSSGLADTDGRLIMEAFTARAELNFGVHRHIKCLVRPDGAERCIGPHYFKVTGSYCDAEGRQLDEWSGVGLVPPERVVHSEWRLHHYFTRSRAHWERRLQRRRWSAPKLNRTEDEFRGHDRNEVFDDSALPFADRVRAQIEMLNAMP